MEDMRLQFQIILLTKGIGETTSSVSRDFIFREAWILKHLPHARFPTPKIMLL